LISSVNSTSLPCHQAEVWVVEQMWRNFICTKTSKSKWCKTSSVRIRISRI